MSDNRIDPKLASAVILILDRVGPALSMGMDMMQDGAPDGGEVTEADTQWMNGVIFGALAAYLHLNTETEVALPEARALFGTASQIISDAIDRYGCLDLDRYAKEVLGLEEVAHV